MIVRWMQIVLVGCVCVGGGGCLSIERIVLDSGWGAVSRWRGDAVFPPSPCCLCHQSVTLTPTLASTLAHIVHI